LGWKLSRIDLCGDHKIRENEEKELVIKLVPEKRAAIHGVVKFPGTNAPVHNAVVKLFEKIGGCCDLKPITFTFTDECGQFLFGVDSCKEYVIKIFFFEPECPGKPHKPCPPTGNHDNDCDCDMDCH